MHVTKVVENGWLVPTQTAKFTYFDVTRRTRIMKRVSISNIYQILPWHLQTVACSIEGYRLARRRFGTEYKDLLAEAASNTCASSEHIASLQASRLEAIFSAAEKTSYGGILKNVGTKNISPLERLHTLPILEKGVVKKNPSQFVNSEVQGTIVAHTSGTTGSALIFPLSHKAEQMQWAMWWRYRLWHGLDPDMWCGYFGGRSIVPIDRVSPPHWRLNYPGKQILFSAYHLSEQRAPDYVEALNRHRPPWLHGYPSQLSLLASFIRKGNLKLSYRPVIITVGAETLLSSQKKLLEEIFECQVRQHYGLAEGVANISECPRGNLHVDEDYSIVEFVESEGDPDSGLYRIVGTNLSNAAFPLLRYDTGDLVRLSGASCNCGRPGRVVSEIIGRKEDVIVLPNGSRVGRLDHIFKDMVNIVEAQIEQLKFGELIFNIVRGNSYSPMDEAMLIQEARERLGDEIRLKIRYVEEIERGPSGKYKFVKSSIQGHSQSVIERQHSDHHEYS